MKPVYVRELLLIVALVFTTSCTTLFGQCGTSPSSGTASVAAANSIVNSYYPGTGSPAQNATIITVGTLDARGSSTAIASGDLVLLIQMQGADINSTNSNSYGDGVAGAPGSGYLSTNLYAGVYEYNTVASIAGSTITFSYGLANNYYTQAFNQGSSLGIRSYQVIRVPRYYDLTINASSSVTAPAWNGATGGVVVLDAANTLNFAAASSAVTVAGKGFRGGGGKNFTGTTTSALTNTDYTFNSAVTTAANTSGGSKGEGIAGTPIYIPNIGGLTTTTGTIEGYLGGSMGRGAPGNAGGGGTDGDPSSSATAANQYNTGGGGGSNGGNGGNGGSGWDGTGGNAAVYPTGGAGGTVFAQGSIGRVIMGGGGGAGTANNSTASDEYYCSGGAGGGIIFMRAKMYSGAGSVIADGTAATDITVTTPTLQTDAAGGGGAGGSIILVTTQTGATGMGSVIVSAKGGKGANMTTYYSHGPGGGGGGGYVYSNNASFTTAPVVTGGTNGLTHLCCTSSTALTDAYGSAAGGNGSVVTLSTFPVLKNPANALSPCGILPITLKDFTAAATGASTVLLSWTAEQQVNFKQFGVEYSTDGIHFNSIGTVLFDAGKTAYQFTHRQAAAAVNYYRLQLVDNDGTFTYSHILAVRTGNLAGTAVAVYPNPAAGNVTIRIRALAAQTGSIRLMDNTGRLLVQKQAGLVQGQNFISFPEMDQLPAGIYHLRITIDGSSYTDRLVKE